jgi:hypothetical protein
MNVGGVVRADLEMEDVSEIEKAHAPAGSRCEATNTRSDSTITVTWTDSNAIIKWERSQGFPMLSTLYFQLQGHGLLEKQEVSPALQEWFSPSFLLAIHCN